MSDLKAFQCPNCHQFINNSMTACKHCGIELDPQTLSSAVNSQEKVDNAYNTATNIRILAVTLMIFFIVSIFIPSSLPFINILSIGVGFVFYIALFGVPVMLVYWLIRYSGIKTADAGFKDAKKYCMTAFFIWLTVFFLWLCLIFLAVFGTMATSGRMPR